MKKTLFAMCAVCLSAQSYGQLEDTFAPLTEGQSITTVDALLSGFDPRKEPLDVEVLKEWEEDGVVMQVLRFRVGVFQGRKAMMAAVYGYPKGGTDLPGLVQVHGGGQQADYRACFTNGKRGYATISLARDGRVEAPGYTVKQDNAELFWAGKQNEPGYMITTDWGGVDGQYSDKRFKDYYGSVAPNEYTIDPVDSPRNTMWHLCTVAARRAITFLEQQPEVDQGRIGIYGHSMGGQISVYTAGSDERIKAAAPSCGGFSYRNGKNINEELGWGNSEYLKRVTCPIVFLSPANDFHGRVNFLPTAISEIKAQDWRITSAPHHNHNDTAPYAVAAQLWFDQYLKGTFKWPATPRTEVKLKTASGLPTVTVRADQSRPIQSLKVYYCQHGGIYKNHSHNAHRFWRSATVRKQGDLWVAELPLYRTDRPLWVYADAEYRLDEPISFSGYYYQDQTAESFHVSSVIELIKPEKLQSAGIKPTIKPTSLIEDFKGNWKDEWFSFNEKTNYWELKTNKLYDPMYRAPKFAKLAFEVRSKQAGNLTLSIDGQAHRIGLDGKGDWQKIVLWPTDMLDRNGNNRLDWNNVYQMGLRLNPKEDEAAIAPELRNLRWLEGTREELNARRTVSLNEAETVDGKIYLDPKYADYVQQNYSIPKLNTSLDGDALAIGDRVYQRGIGSHANSEMTFFLNEEFKRFYAEVGVQQGVGASIGFTVFADDVVVYESGMMGKNQPPKVVDLDLSGVSEIRLVIDDGGNGIGSDHGNWAEAYVTKTVSTKDSLPPLQDGQAPQTLEELWGDYDPRSEPIEAKVIREWEEDGIVIRYITYTIGRFKGQKSTMSGFYAFPKGQTNLPAILEFHGGGGRALVAHVKWAALNGYAGLSVNWGGERPLSDLKDTEPNTDWGALGVRRTGHNLHYNSMEPDELTIDSVKSPRNNNWFLLTLGCRRGITFLEQQPEVNPELIGVTGLSVGGKLTMDVAAIDSRIKVAAPRCGGAGSADAILSGMPGSGVGGKQDPLMLATIDDVPYLKLLKCPTIFISPTNDFAAPMDNMYLNESYTDTPFFYYAVSPHYNHRHYDAFKVHTLLVFEKFLKDAFSYPEKPMLSVNLKTEDGIPMVKLELDRSRPIEKVDIYYSIDPHSITRFWRDAEAKPVGDAWVAKCPIMSTSQPLFFYANVTYQADLSSYRHFNNTGGFENQFALSSNMLRITSEELKAAGVQATDKPSRLVDDFKRGQHDWYTKNWGNRHHWHLSTRKMKDPKYRPPHGAKLLLDVKSDTDNILVCAFTINEWGAYPGKPAGSFNVVKEIKGSPEWQTIAIAEQDLLPSNFPRRKEWGLPIPHWEYITDFTLKSKGSIIKDGQKINIGHVWQGDWNFRNLRWEGGSYPDKIVVSGGAVDLSEDELNSQIQSAINESWEGTDNYVEAQMHDWEVDALGRVYLTPTMATTTDTFLNLVGKDSNIDGDKKISIGGKAYERGLGVHAKSTLVFPLDGKYATFHVIPGPDDSHNGTIEMNILVDGTEVYTSGKVNRLTHKPSPLNLPVSGANTLTLIVTDGGDGLGGDHASWAEAYLRLKQ
mgnify:FL=1